jgi:hypothetical protein
MHSKQKKSAKSKLFQYHAANSVRTAPYSRKEHLLCKYIGTAIIPVVPAFPVVPVFPVVPAFPVVPVFPVVPAFVRPCFPVLLAILRSFQSLKSKEIKQGEARQTLAVLCALPIATVITY